MEKKIKKIIKDNSERTETIDNSEAYCIPDDNYERMTNQFLSLIQAERENVLQEVEEQVIGEDESNIGFADFGDGMTSDNLIRNEFRAKQRVKLQHYRKSRQSKEGGEL